MQILFKKDTMKSTGIDDKGFESKVDQVVWNIDFLKIFYFYIYKGIRHIYFVACSTTK